MEDTEEDKLILGLRKFISLIETFKEPCGEYLHLKEIPKSDKEEIKNTLSDLILKPDYTLKVAQCFPHTVLELLFLAENRANNSSLVSYDKNHIHRQMCLALGKLVNCCPEVIRYSFQYFEHHSSPFQDISAQTLTPSSPKKRKVIMTPVTDLQIIESCYNFLHASGDYFRQSWSWSEFIELYTGHKDNFICWLVCNCIATVTAMTDTQRQLFLSNCMSSKMIRTCTIKYDHFKNEHRRVKEEFLTNTITSFESSCEVSKMVVSVSGVQLPVFNAESQDKNGCLVLVKSTVTNLRRLALAISSGKAICLQGPVGCGKTSLVEHLALLTGRKKAPNFIKVQLGDQTDSKMLLGTYRCTDVPGEFVWQPGVLTQAVVGGHWVLLEDIDSAAADVVSVLTSLVETGTLSVPGYRDSIKVAPGFQLFVTKRLMSSLSGLHSRQIDVSAFLEKHWMQVNVEPLSKKELAEIVKAMFPMLNTIATRIVDVFLLFSVGNHCSVLQSEINKENYDSCHTQPEILVTGQRLTSTRDLIKWCARSVEGFNVSSQDSALKVLQDAIDIFCCSVIDKDMRLRLAVLISTNLGIVKTKAEYFYNTYKPTIKISSLNFIAGRCSLPINADFITNIDSVTQKSTFSYTRPAACLLERIACCVARQEPVLLVGETGTGKTSAVQYLAGKTGHHLLVINMNQQSDSADLLGGYKPIDLKYVVRPVKEEFEMLFKSFFSVTQNIKFLGHIETCFYSRRWNTLLKLMKHSHNAAVKRLCSEESLDLKNKQSRILAWQQLGGKLLKLETQLKSQSALAFSFIEGSLVRALREGYWVLLDEINLASAETLECLSGLLEGSAGSLHLLERGDQEPIKRHSNFRLFACMNPATDIGKKDLPAGLRNRFTEFFVDELTEKNDLLLLVGTYLQNLSLPNKKLHNLINFYLNVRKEATLSLNDGTGHKPHYSLRTLCRALNVATQNNCGSVPRSLYEAFCLSFLTQLDYSSHPVVEGMIARAVVGSTAVGNILTKLIPEPTTTIVGEKFLRFEGYWVPQGKLEPNIDEKYILTPSVRRNLRDLVRIASIGRHPVLLQGETSVGKTSLITYLAKASGNHCVRINNHEHTDLQEYIGSYSADEQGHLVFKEGVLVEAMRKGYWIILDELNLAPTDVLEALNRVLDDNRELFIPETQDIVKAHSQFMLFATQNPPGLYGGRKMLSRAFRNRFVELHFDEIPAKELETILHKRCDMPLSYCKKMIEVMTELQVRRKGSAAFQGKQGFITLRDLFRWGERYRLAEVGKEYYDWYQHIADEGYLVLAGRVRKQEECYVIQEVIKKHITRAVDPEKLFTLNDETSSVTRNILEKVLRNPLPGFEHVVWTYNMRRLAVLVGKACQFSEPVLLVGETGCGKTTICQMLAVLHQQTLYSVNCHMHTESSDFLGGLRPVREYSSDPENQKLFEWVDGPLIEAMQKGDLFLADEISLADDSVLERLNSLLEPERKLLLAEKGGGEIGTNDSCVIVARDNFHFIGTMNPGGDYGKKELSPALRNRFTEIWCEKCYERKDLLAIIEHNLSSGLLLCNQEDGSSGVGNKLLDFIDWFTNTEIGKRFTISIRDILTWVNFINVCTEDPHTHENNANKLDIATAYIHGACLTFLDSLGSGITSLDSIANLKPFRTAALKYLMEQAEMKIQETASHNKVIITDIQFGIHPFYILRGKLPVASDMFTFHAPTTGLNATRVLRGLQLKKPVLLEGSPGVGKTSLVAALAKAAGYHLTRINVSDQTDVSDLFGADLPIEGGEGGQFAWRDGPFLRALKSGDWILLDEVNLASQSVLEGLNACLDHRGEVFIPELGKTFQIHSESTRLFAAQNPLRQGGARRGLPQSFLNRFTQVYVDSLTEPDLKFIIQSLFPILPQELVCHMVKFNSRLARETGELRLWGQKGAPWDLNLRDLSRWCEAMIADVKSTSNCNFNPGKYVDLVYMDRMRSKEDKEKVKQIYIEEFGLEYPLTCDFPRIHITHSALFVDDISLSRNGLQLRKCSELNIHKEAEESMEVDKESESHGEGLGTPIQSLNENENSMLLLRRQFPVLRSLARCINMNWLVILTGPTGSGKTSIVHLLAQLLGVKLHVLSVNSVMDTTEILGGFEQADYNRHLDEIAARIERLLLDAVRRRLLTTIDSSPGSPSRRDVTTRSCAILRLWEDYRKLTRQDANKHHQTLATETELFNHRLGKLQEITTVLLIENESSESRRGFLTELRNFKEKLNKLAQNVSKEQSLNAGGKFEWIDSILVKCLQEGSWLLVDNVNLCSPAVLDRLNALLEPNGVLTIGERGVDLDGKLVTVTPHPAFRLFFAMDPHNGEISRAMRNRGVEIYMLGPSEEKYNSLDTRCLLNHVGLKIQNQQDALLSIHQVMADINQGVGEPSMSQLLQAAFLIAQQISIGQPQYEAFLFSCTDVYVRSLTKAYTSSQSFQAFQQKCYQALEETLNHSTLKDSYRDCVAKKVSLDCITPTTSKLRENATYTNIKQHGVLLKALLEALASAKSEKTEQQELVGLPNTESLNVLFDIRKESFSEKKWIATYSISDIIPYILLIFYKTASFNDIHFRHKWILDLISNLKKKTLDSDLQNLLNKYINISGNIVNIISNGILHVTKNEKTITQNCSISDLPWDIRWLPEIGTLYQSHDTSSKLNRLSVLIFFRAKILQLKRQTEENSAKKKNSISVLEYSTALDDGSITDSFINHCVITKFKPLLCQFDVCLEAALKSNNIELEDNKYADLIKSVEWRFRFAEFGNLELIHKRLQENSTRSENLVDEAISILGVHYKWFSRNTLQELQLLLQQDEMLKNSTLVKQFYETVHMIDASLEVSSSELLPVAKKLKISMDQPLPHASIIQAKLWERIKRLSNVISVWQGCLSQDNKFKTSVNFLQTCEGMNTRLSIIKANQYLIMRDNFEEVSTILTEGEKCCLESGFASFNPDIREEYSQKETHDSNLEICLWPAHEIISIVFSGALRRVLLKNMSDITCHINDSRDVDVSSYKNLASTLYSFMVTLPSIPPSLVSTLKCYALSNELSSSSPCSLSQFLMLMLQHSQLSPCVYNLKDWLSWKKDSSNSEDDDGDEMRMQWSETENLQQESFPLHCPIMTELVTTFALPSNESNAASSSLHSHKISKCKLSRMKELLWRNMDTFSTPELNYKLNDAMSVDSFSKIFIHSLNLAVVKDESTLIEKSLAKQIEAIVQKISDCNVDDTPASENSKTRKIFIDVLLSLSKSLTSLGESIKNTVNNTKDADINFKNDFEILRLTGEAWLFIGFVQVILFSNLGLIDPIAKKKLKLEYATKEALETEMSLYSEDLQSRICSTNLDDFDESNIHPHIKILRKRLEHLKIQKNEFKKCVAARPDPPLFDPLAKETYYYYKSLASGDVILNMHKNIVEMILKLCANGHSQKETLNLIIRAEEILKEVQIWDQSQLIFCNKISNLYEAWYPDMAVPLLSAATQLCYGMKLLGSILKKQITQLKVISHISGLSELQNVDTMMYNLVRFPTIGDGQEFVMSLINTCTSKVTASLIKSTLPEENVIQIARKELYQLLKSSLQELQNVVMISRELQTDVCENIIQILGHNVRVWRQEEDERKQKEEEENSLYVTKGKTQCKPINEEEEDEMEITELFPASIDEDFGDLQQNSTLEKIADPAATADSSDLTVTDEEMAQICNLHSHVMQSYTKSAWLFPSYGNEKYHYVKPDFIQPLMLRYRTFCLLLNKLSRGLDNSLDQKLYPSLILVASVGLNIVDKGSVKFSDLGYLTLPSTPFRHSKLPSMTSGGKIFNFYKDSNATEVKQCYPVLLSLMTRIKELLVDWPEHPSLNQMVIVIERVINFPLTSPVSRFLTGFELLLDKMQEWEQNAHLGVSISTYWKQVTDQIGSWRKLELQCWKDCLDGVAYEIHSKASKWWFYIYSLVDSYVSKDIGSDIKQEMPSSKDLIKTLQKFMEQSTLGEFEARLNILFSFHCHVIHMQPTTERDELMNILWNTYSYFSQFTNNVVNKIKEQRTPIEKKLKDCIKIFRWDDYSYWAVKEAIKKVHKSLHKFIKQFKEILSQPVLAAFSNPTEIADVNEGAWDRPHRHQPKSYQPIYESANFLSNPKLKKFSSLKESEKEGDSLLSNCGSLFMKSRKLSRIIIMETVYAKNVQAVDGLVTEIIETTNHLRNLKVSEDITGKAKRKSQAKNFLQQKRKALADLFRTLHTMGLSYKTGLTHWNADEIETSEFTLPPLDLRAAFHYLKKRRADGQLLSVWDGCETYFLRSMARLALLHTSLEKPSKELGPPIIERCRGYALHLMVLSREQKQRLSESSQFLCSLRNRLAQLHGLGETEEALPKQSELKCWMIRLKEMIVTCIICLEQIRILLYCCPTEEEQYITSNLGIPIMELKDIMTASLIVEASKGDDTWKTAVETIKSIISSATKLQSTIEKSDVVSSSLYNRSGSTEETNTIMANEQYETMIDTCKQVEGFIHDLNNVIEVFSRDDKSQVHKTNNNKQNNINYNPLVENLIWLRNIMSKETKEFTLLFRNNYEKAVTLESKEEIPSALKLKRRSLDSEENITIRNFRNDAENFLKNVLLGMQRIHKKYTKISEDAIGNTKMSEELTSKNDTEKEGKDREGNDEDENAIEEVHLKEKVIDSLSDTIHMFHINKINADLQELMKQLYEILDSENNSEEKLLCKRLLLQCLPCLDQLVLLYQFFVTQQVASLRVSCKLLSVLLAVFLELAQKGFCIPPEFDLSEEKMDQHGLGGMGLDDGEGEKDVSDQIETEDQLEDARPKGEEKTEEDKDCKEEEKGIEMSQDFDGNVQDLEKSNNSENEEEENENDLDKEMGETDFGADKLDREIWGSDSEDEEDDNENEENKEEKEETGTGGEKVGESELAAKDENAQQDNEKESESEEPGKEEPKKKDINEMKNQDENDDQIDPYHGKHEPHPEPEPLDLPEDLQLDDGEMKEDGDEQGDEDPFDIDKMKEPKLPENDTDGKEETEKENTEEENKDDDEQGEGETMDNENEGKDDKEDKEGPEDQGIEDGGEKDENKTGEEQKIEPEKENETAKASEDQPSCTPAEAAENMDQVQGSQDQVTAQKEEVNAEQQPSDNKNEDGKEEKQGVGQAQAEEKESGHTGDMIVPDKTKSGKPEMKRQKEKRQHFKESDSNRSLGEVSEPVKKKLRTMNVINTEEKLDDNNEVNDDDQSKQEQAAEMYQHIKEATKSFDTQVLDGATEEQAEKQPVPNLEDEDADKPTEDDDIKEHEDDDSFPDKNEVPIQQADKLASDKKSKDKSEESSGQKVDEGGDVEMGVEVEGEKVETLGAARGSETTFHTIFGEISTDVSQADLASMEDYNALRSQLESQLATWSQPPASAEAEKAWESFSTVTSGLARDLSEQLRLVLEPTQASQLRGDYRTGRRINMRKVIPYIASQFRKDKIWLRRTKPSKREYQIILAIDDSSSMADNHSKELAFESLALVSRALTLLEAGELAVISFGETPKVLHQLGESFSEQSGARLLQQFSFEQKNTRVGQLVDFATTMFMENSSRASSSNDCAQLLIIISDGRIISESSDRVKQAVRRAKFSGIFMVFLIIDNPENKDSILDIQQPIFNNGKCEGFSSYMDNFPFPFYLLLRDINALPGVLSDALRQWFELVTNIDK